MLLIGAEATKPHKIGCSECGKEIRAWVVHCPYCGGRHETTLERGAADVLLHQLTAESHASANVAKPIAGTQAPEDQPISYVHHIKSVAEVELSDTDANSANQAHSQPLDSAPLEVTPFPSKGGQQIPKKVLAVAAILLLAGWGYLTYGTRTPRDESTPRSEVSKANAPQSAAQSVSQTAPQVARQTVTIPDSVTNVTVSKEWQRVDLARDLERPVIRVSGKQPFRLRVNGQLYLIAGASPQVIEFGNATFIELKAVRLDTAIQIARSPSGGQ